MLLLHDGGKLQAYQLDGKPIASLGENVKSFVTSRRGHAVLVRTDTENTIWTDAGTSRLPPVNELANIELSPDGSAALLISKTEGVQLWSSTRPLRQLSPKATQASFNHDGTHVFTLADGVIEIFQTIETSQPRRLALADARFTDGEFNRGRDLLLTLSDDDVVRLWRADGALVELLARGVDNAKFSVRRPPHHDYRYRRITVKPFAFGTSDLSDVMRHLDAAVERSGQCLSVSQRESFLGETREAATNAVAGCQERAKKRRPARSLSENLSSTRGIEEAMSGPCDCVVGRPTAWLGRP